MAAEEALAPTLEVLNCVTLRPTMEEFRDELKFLSSKEVQDAGKKCGIVRVVAPREYQPSKLELTDADAEANPEVWTLEIPVLEQRFPKLSTGPGKGKSGMYVVGRRQTEPYVLPSVQWREMANIYKEKTLVKMQEAKQKETRKRQAKQLERKDPVEPDYVIPKLPRHLYWESRPYQNTAFYGADVPDSVMRPDQDIETSQQAWTQLNRRERMPSDMQNSMQPADFYRGVDTVYPFKQMPCFCRHTCWNFNSPDFPCMTRTFKDQRTPGVYTPYLYIGSWGASFGLHPEDKDLYSLNYLHEGDSKFWYGMSSDSSAAVEEFGAELLPDEAAECEQFLRHKTLLIQPEYFLRRGIQVYAAEQKQGDLMITFPNAYHYGFNSGFNVAEARNIATPDWLDFGLKAKRCSCTTYNFDDVLPRERIVEMALACDPVKYAYLKSEKRPASDEVSDDQLLKRVKLARHVKSQ